MPTQFKRRRLLRFPITLCLACLVFLAGCQVGALFATATPTATLQPTATTTATPTPAPVITIQNVDDQYPDGLLEFAPDFTGFQSGTYLVGEEGDSDGPSAVYYSSINGNLSGNIAYFREDSDPFLSETNVTSDKSLFSTPGDLEYMEIVGVKVSAGKNDNYSRLIKMRIYSAGLISREQHIWHAIFQSANGLLCDGVSLSPDHKWVVGNCWNEEEGENYVYVIDVQQSTARLLHPAQYRCSSEEYVDIEWANFSWSPDGKRFSTSCVTVTPHSYTSCLVSPITGEFSCRPDGYYRPEAWSPDGSKVAVLVDDFKNILITDAACLKDARSCPEYFRSPLNPIYGTSEGNMHNIVWDPTGKVIVWSIYKENLDGAYPTSIWVVNLENDNEYQIEQGRGITVHSISPDGNLMVINKYDHYGYKLLTLDGQVVQELANFHIFWGWLVIP